MATENIYLQMINNTTKFSNCQACELRSNCHNVVRGLGLTSAKLLIIMNKPRIDDDLTAEAISGAKEKRFFSKICTGAEIKKEDIYFTNLVKCHTYEDVKKIHIDSCKIWLWKELQAIKPEVIITMGRAGFDTLFPESKKKDFGELAGLPVVYDFKKFASTIIPWYDINYLLNRNRKFIIDTIKVFREAKKIYVSSTNNK
jgi:uracil-DNA glycosylase